MSIFSHKAKQKDKIFLKKNDSVQEITLLPANLLTANSLEIATICFSDNFFYYHNMTTICAVTKCFSCNFKNMQLIVVVLATTSFLQVKNNYLVTTFIIINLKYYCHKRYKIFQFFLLKVICFQILSYLFFYFFITYNKLFIK